MKFLFKIRAAAPQRGSSMGISGRGSLMCLRLAAIIVSRPLWGAGQGAGAANGFSTRGQIGRFSFL